MKALPATTFSRVLLVALMMLSWLVLTNHCGLALAHGQFAHLAKPSCCQKAEPPAHGSVPCHESTPCCKVVKASVPDSKVAKLDAGFALLPVLAVMWLLTEPAADTKTQPSIAHDPPRVVSFAEAVLQRSLLCHAPPFAV